MGLCIFTGKPSKSTTGVNLTKHNPRVLRSVARHEAFALSDERLKYVAKMG